ncbi:MAG: Xaa-Pro peptidase family protein [Albidovulum sp.]|nr:Xaa-Pro peptidase family protein [Albidovulum sp.]MDE0305077.1 Xaa-Pro peptidase family protein [Albidovulum sp.]MDE0533539.1 Xaa-Pro peptidase family protein [Albidovulum sp.]
MNGIAAPWFDKSEYEDRLARVQVKLADRGLDGLIAFQPETVTWLTGFFTRGYGTFQCAIVPAEGRPAIVCRDVEEYYLDATCVFSDRAMWKDGEDPFKTAASAAIRHVGGNVRLGVELASGSLSASGFKKLRESLPAAIWRNESRLAADMRLIKSPAEIEYQRRAGKVAEAGMQAAIDTAGIGVSEREIAAEICAAMIRAGSDLPGPGVLSSGERALHLHGGYSDRVLKRGDIVQVETTPNVRHYHARFMRPIRVAEATEDDRSLVEALISIQDAALAEVRPGVAACVPDKIYRDGVLSNNFRDTYTNKTFYSVGLLLPPSGGEPLEAVPGSDWVFESGMTFHTYVLARGFGMSETIAVTGEGIERLTNFPRRLFVA